MSDLDLRSKETWRQRIDRPVLLLAGSILLFAAVMKAWQLATVPILGEGLLHARWFNVLVVEFELFWGLGILFGLFPNLVRKATIGLFVLFAGVSLYKAISGEASCGCFGKAEVNPWWTVSLDTLITLLLLWCLPISHLSGITFNQIFLDWQKIISVVVIWFFLGAFCYGIINYNTFQALVDVGQVIDHGKTVQLNLIYGLAKNSHSQNILFPNKIKQTRIAFFFYTDPVVMIVKRSYLS